MKAQISEIMTGTGLLIGIYLFLSRGNETANIIKAFGEMFTKSVSTLQGR